MRKEANFEINDRIIISANFSDELKNVIEENKEYFMNEVLCKDIVANLKNFDYNSFFKYENKKIEIYLKKFQRKKLAKKKTKYTKAELKKFEANILKKIDEVNESIEGVRSNTKPTNSVFIQERSEDFNEGTEAHEVEKNFLLMSRESDYLVNLQKALQRIKDGTYGICEVSGELISEERLMEVPNATKSVINKERKKLNLI